MDNCGRFVKWRRDSGVDVSPRAPGVHGYGIAENNHQYREIERKLRMESWDHKIVLETLGYLLN